MTTRTNNSIFFGPFGQRGQFLTCVAVAAALAMAAGARAANVFNDDFSGAAVNPAKWTEQAIGFEQFDNGGPVVATVGSGQLTMSGPGNLGYWSGLSLQSVPTFSSSDQTIVTVDRVSLSGSGLYGSQIGLYSDGTHYLRLNHTNESTRFNYNYADGGGNVGVFNALTGATNFGQLTMKLIVTPTGTNQATVEMFTDATPIATQVFNNWTVSDFRILVGGNARLGGDTVNAVFDNANVEVISGPAVPVEIDTNNNTGFTVSNSDLIEGVVPAVVGNINAEEGVTTNDPAALTNGQFGVPGLPGDGSDASNVVAIHNGVTLTYSLDTGASPRGYNVTDINTYTGWRDGGRDAQQYSVLYSTVASPGTFIPLATVNYNPGSPPSPSDTEVLLSESGGGVLATSVAAVRFSFPSTEAGFVGYRELDVIGSPVPEPSTFLLAAIGLLGLMGFTRRIRRTAR